MKVDVMFHCGNAPKMERVIDLTIAMANKNLNQIKAHVREDFKWKIVGEEVLFSLEDMSQVLANKPKVSAIKIENALSHGNGAMCEGILTLDHGNTLRFCHVVTFVNTAKNAQIKEAHTYLI